MFEFMFVEEADGKFKVLDENRVLVATVATREDAELFATAPAMFALLRACQIEVMPDDEGRGNMDLWKKIGAVIKDAQGGRRE